MRFLGKFAALGVMAAVSAAASPAAASTVVANYQMNEGAGAKTMIDSSGHGLNGTIGSLVNTGVSIGGSQGYKFTSSGAVSTQHLVQVPDNALLNPGSENLRIDLAVRTTGTGEYNVFQKGQSGNNAMFKVEINSNGKSPGVPHCEFQGTSGTGSVSGSNKINDGIRHTLTCIKTDTQVSILVDGKPAAPSRQVAVGSIAPSGWPLSIGGKSRCNGSTVDCDYFDGAMDFAVVTRG